MHIKTFHCDHKDHKCESCDKSFSQGQNLKKHMFTIHEQHKNLKLKVKTIQQWH